MRRNNSHEKYEHEVGRGINPFFSFNVSFYIPPYDIQITLQPQKWVPGQRSRSN